MTWTATKRDELVDALGDRTGDPTRVHRHRPDNLAAPCLFIDEPRHRPSSDGATVDVEFPVVVVVDGAIGAQLRKLDDLVDRAIAAAYDVGELVDSRPTPLDVGGPTLRARTVTAGVTVEAFIWCTPTP